MYQELEKNFNIYTMNPLLKNKFAPLNFDVEEPTNGHFNRFEKKIQSSKKDKKRHVMYKSIAIAASFLLLISIAFQITARPQKMTLSDVSPQMKKTENYFTGIIQKELKTIYLQKDKNTQKLIKDTQKQLEKLNIEYQKLSINLSKNGYNKRIINAMIYNYQQRISILKDILLKIETIKNLKNNNYETYS